ncbi:hypothetical protein EHP00_472 [Ecytonucleospora hepatopenaei]|uniref:Uncharacterized protein n=1 Tax=Ecytonucleospora hepatopenaei TaxID=646526 RepID=A0A1W0E8Z4_9MICR|nr:hypothetical protein EHP00_2591 [Ecytonucleospora hepatopenaei]OQS55755.1 hypothetical protein EHP00_472 [Ecytonucleospora hepatopenaei]
MISFFNFINFIITTNVITKTFDKSTEFMIPKNASFNLEQRLTLTLYVDKNKQKECFTIFQLEGSYFSCLAKKINFIKEHRITLKKGTIVTQNDEEVTLTQDEEISNIKGKLTVENLPNYPHICFIFESIGNFPEKDHNSMIYLYRNSLIGLEQDTSKKIEVELVDGKLQGSLDFCSSPLSLFSFGITPRTAEKNEKTGKNIEYFNFLKIPFTFENDSDIDKCLEECKQIVFIRPFLLRNLSLLMYDNKEAYEEKISCNLVSIKEVKFTFSNNINGIISVKSSEIKEQKILPLKPTGHGHDSKKLGKVKKESKFSKASIVLMIIIPIACIVLFVSLYFIYLYNTKKRNNNFNKI